MSKLRIEKSQNRSGKLRGQRIIPHLREDEYQIIPVDLDGDAPKQFIRAYFYEPNVFKAKPKTWKRFIAKTAEKWYPHESVVEYIVNQLGEVLGLRMNRTRLVVVNQQIRFLSEYFLDRKTQIMIHGAEICGQYLEDDDFAHEVANDKQSARELFTFEFISEAIRAVFPTEGEQLLVKLIRMIVFDAIVGNNDRHFYNWAVIVPVKKGTSRPYFAPLYDSARGLLWNWSDDNLVRQYNLRKQGGRKVEKYIQKAAPRISIEGNSAINHFDLVKHIWVQHPQHRETIRKLLSLAQQRKVLKTYHDRFDRLFITERNQLVDFVIRTRFATLREITQTDV